MARVRGLRLVNSYILTRLLFPEAFGQMILVTTVIVGITMLSDIGLAPSVIQSVRGDEPGFLNTAWTLQVLRGIGLWFLALLLAWPAAHIYHDSRLTLVLSVLALSTIITGFNSTNILTLARHMSVRLQFIIEVHHPNRRAGCHHHLGLLLSLRLGAGRRKSRLEPIQASPQSFLVHSGNSQ